jgi:hypothetical protein
MLSLPDAELYVWVRWNSQGKRIAKEIIDLIGFQPYEKCIYQGACDIRWETKDFSTAVQLAEKLRKYIDNPDVTLIKATGEVAGQREVLALKDLRQKNIQ